MADDGNVQVFCRVRPPNEREGGASAFTKKCVAVPSSDPLQQTVLLQLKGMPAQAAPKTFTFDRVFHELSSQNEVFERVGVPITRACLEGYNGTIFAYGQTGSGKTFTMQGPDDVIDSDARVLTERERGLRGLVPRVFDYLFQDAHVAGPMRVATDTTRVEHTFACSFMEIYNERVYDLLDLGSTRDAAGLTLRENGRKGVSVEGLIESVVTNAKQAAELMAVGARNRRVGQTAMNRESSRSHSVFVLQIQSKETTDEGVTRTRLSRFNLVDLAGSERQKNTETDGERLKEAGSINKSLSALGNVIMGLVEQSAGKNRHVHYRDSKLTFLLKDSLGGNSKTFMIATVSPAEDSSHETLSTLKFAQRAKLIRNNAVINEDTSGSVLVLQEEIVRLRRQLQEAHSGGHNLVGEARLLSSNNPRAVANEGAHGFDSGLSERLEELEASLAFTLEKNERLVRANGQLSARSNGMHALCSELKRNVSNLKLRLRLRSGVLSDDVADYESSADAIEWRMKYEELEESYIELQGRLRTSPNDCGGEVQTLNNMYLILTKQLAHAIREKHDISRKLDGKPVVVTDEEDKLARLKSEMAKCSSEFESRLNSILAINAAAEAKAEAATLELLHGKQKEAAWKIEQHQAEVVIAQLQERIQQLEGTARMAQESIIEERQQCVELEMRLRHEHNEHMQYVEDQLAEKMTENFNLARAQDQLRSELDDVVTERGNLKTQLQVCEAQLDATKEELQTALSSVAARAQELQTLSARHDAYKADQEARYEELQLALSSTVSSLEKMRDEMSTKLTTTQAKISHLELVKSELKANLEETTHVLVKEQGERRTAETNLAAVSETLLQAQADNQNLTASVHDSEADKQRGVDELRRIEEELSNTNKRLSTTEEAYRVEAEQHATAQGSLREQLGAVTHELDSANQVIATQKIDMQRHGNAIERLSNEIEELSSKKYELERNIVAMELLRQEEESAYEASRCSWEKTTAVIQEAFGAAELAKHASEEALIATLSELADCKQALEASRSELNESKRKIVIAEQERESLIAARERSEAALTHSIEELQQLVDEQRRAVELQKKEAEGTVHAMSRLRQELDDSLEKVSRQRKRNDTLVETNAHLSRDVEEKVAAVLKLEQELLVSHERQSTTDTELQQTRLELAASKDECVKLEAKYTELSDQFDSAKEDLKKKQSNWEAKDKELQGRMSVVGEMEVQIADESRKLTDEKVSVAQKKKEVEKFRREYEQLKVRVGELEALKIQLSKEKEKYQREVNILTQKLDQISKENDKLVGHDNKRQKIQHHIKVKEENNRLQSEVRLLTEEKLKLEVRIGRLELSLKEKENLVNDAQVDVSRSPSSAKSNASLRTFAHGVSSPGAKTSPLKAPESGSGESSARKRMRTRIE